MPVLIINPGTGAVAGTNEDHAITNMQAFTTDLALEKVAFGRAPEYDDGEGRYAFRVFQVGGKAVIVLMVGLPLEQVRFVDEKQQNIWGFPRLYVDGSSWVWKFAVSITRATLLGEE